MSWESFQFFSFFTCFVFFYLAYLSLRAKSGFLSFSSFTDISQSLQLFIQFPLWLWQTNSPQILCPHCWFFFFNVEHSRSQNLWGHSLLVMQTSTSISPPLQNHPKTTQQTLALSVHASPFHSVNLLSLWNILLFLTFSFFLWVLWVQMWTSSEQGPCQSCSHGILNTNAWHQRVDTLQICVQ